METIADEAFNDRAGRYITMMESKYNFINDDIKIDIKSLPEVLQEAIGRAEQAEMIRSVMKFMGTILIL